MCCRTSITNSFPGLHSETFSNVTDSIPNTASFCCLNANYQLPVLIYLKVKNTDSRFPPQQNQFDYHRPPSPPYGRHFLFLFLTLPVRNTRLFMDLVYFSLTFIIVNLDIVRIEGVNETPDVEMTEMDLLLTPTLVFGFSLNDKIWCTF